MKNKEGEDDEDEDGEKEAKQRGQECQCLSSCTTEWMGGWMDLMNE